MLFVLVTTALVSSAGVVVQIVPPNFGEIDMHPLGGAVVIAAQNGPAEPMSSYSVVTGGGSGRLILASPDLEQVDVLYPSHVILTNGSSSITLSEINNFSQSTAVLQGEGCSRSSVSVASFIFKVMSDVGSIVVQ